jgi:signal transduction histidine kinase
VEEAARAAGLHRPAADPEEALRAVEAQQLAESLCAKRALIEAARTRQLELEQRVEERTRELERALVLAEDAARAKSEFLANMSHELRTPMTAVLGFSSLLRDPRLSAAERDEHLETLRRNGDHLLAVLNDILDLSKLDAQQMILEVLPTDAPALFGELASLMRVQAAEKRIGFELVYENALPERIATDPTRLRQILLNLLGNAIKFTQQGFVRLRVRLLEPPDAEPSLAIAVEDSGVGIPKEQRERLFHAFQQGDASTTRRFGGTGWAS